MICHEIQNSIFNLKQSVRLTVTKIWSKKENHRLWSYRPSEKRIEKKTYLKPDSRIGAAVAGLLISLPIDSWTAFLYANWLKRNVSIRYRMAKMRLWMKRPRRSALWLVVAVPRISYPVIVNRMVNGTVVWE